MGTWCYTPAALLWSVTQGSAWLWWLRARGAWARTPSSEVVMCVRSPCTRHLHPPLWPLLLWSCNPWHLVPMPLPLGPSSCKGYQAGPASSGCSGTPFQESKSTAEHQIHPLAGRTVSPRRPQALGAVIATSSLDESLTGDHRSCQPPPALEFLSGDPAASSHTKRSTV